MQLSLSRTGPGTQVEATQFPKSTKEWMDKRERESDRKRERETTPVDWSRVLRRNVCYEVRVREKSEERESDLITRPVGHLHTFPDGVKRGIESGHKDTMTKTGKDVGEKIESERERH